MKESFQKGEFRISDISGDAGTVSRLYELGFYKNLQIKIIGRAPFMGPILVKVQNHIVALRTSEFENLELERVS